MLDFDIILKVRNYLIQINPIQFSRAGRNDILRCIATGEHIDQDTYREVNRLILKDHPYVAMAIAVEFLSYTLQDPTPDVMEALSQFKSLVVHDAVDELDGDSHCDVGMIFQYETIDLPVGVLVDMLSCGDTSQNVVPTGPRKLDGVDLDEVVTHF